MSKRRLLFISAVVALVAAAAILFLVTRIDEEYPVTPTTRDGERWRLAYYEGGPYIDYAGGLQGLTDGLSALGWLPDVDVPEFEQVDDTRAVWQFLAEEVESPYLEFLPDAYWSANWEDAQRERNRQQALYRLSEEEDIDLIIAMGTWAGQDLATDDHSVPTLVFNSSGPVRAGIIASAEDSGRDHVLAEYDPYRYLRQIRLFHDIVDFDRLGVTYEDSENGRIYANVPDLKQVAGERGFELVECHARDTNVTELEAREGLLRCYRTLAPQIDALWIGTHQGEHPKFMPEILEPLFEHDVATWAQVGSDAVRRGVLISISQQDYQATGRWYARRVAQVLNGARPRELDQIFEIPTDIAINLETARRIDFEAPPGLVEAADEVYSTIETGDYP